MRQLKRQPQVHNNSIDYVAQLHKARRDQKKPQRVVADAVGVSIGTLSNWENKYFRPDFEYFLKWCEVLGVNIQNKVINK